MPGMFCRHNRLTANCPICSREQEETLRKAAPSRPVRPRAKSASSSTSIRSRRTSAQRPGGVVTRKLARAADDGYRNALVPGLRATVDAERLAVAVTQAARRLEFPGPYPKIAEEPDLEQATYQAFLIALGEGNERTIEAYQAWVERAGSQEAAFTGEASWTPERRFGRIFERLALPGFTRAARFDLLAALGAAGRYELAADALHFAEDDATTAAAKRVLVSGDTMLLERRAKDLAQASGLPLAAFDRGLAVWGTPGEHVDLAEEPDPGVADALTLA
jgi:Alpha-glutamyl/putrescinyl thymine pyrophosphorylase clade 3